MTWGRVASSQARWVPRCHQQDGESRELVPWALLGCPAPGCWDKARAWENFWLGGTGRGSSPALEKSGRDQGREVAKLAGEGGVCAVRMAFLLDPA